MPIPNGGLITETNEQYYAGAQRFLSDGTGVITTTFNTDLILGSSDPNALNYIQVLPVYLELMRIIYWPLQ